MRLSRVKGGGTTFTFVTDGIHSALAQAKAAAGDRSADIAGGASTVRPYLEEGLIDELQLHVVPALLGHPSPPISSTASWIEVSTVVRR